MPLRHLMLRVSVSALLALAASTAGAQVKSKIEVAPPLVVLRAPAPPAHVFPLATTPPSVVMVSGGIPRP